MTCWRRFSRSCLRSNHPRNSLTPFVFALLVSVLSLQIPQISTGTLPWELGTRIVADVPGQVIACRHYRLAEDLGAHTCRVWNANGEKVAEVQFADETASGWQEQALSMPLHVAAGDVFTVSVPVPGGVHFPILPQGFAMPITDGHLTYRAGAFSNMPGQFPSIEAVASYFRDVMFVPDQPDPSIAIVADSSGGFVATLKDVSPGAYVLGVTLRDAVGGVVSSSLPITVPNPAESR